MRNMKKKKKKRVVYKRPTPDQKIYAESKGENFYASENKKQSWDRNNLDIWRDPAECPVVVVPSPLQEGNVDLLEDREIGWAILDVVILVHFLLLVSPVV